MTYNMRLDRRITVIRHLYHTLSYIPSQSRSDQKIVKFEITLSSVRNELQLPTVVKMYYCI